jgi:DNA-binding MarR family transcriptional regulator
MEGAPARSGTWAETLLSFVQRYPGVHLREIRRRLAIPIGTLDYHLYRLGRQGLIAVRMQGGYKCCFPELPIGSGPPIPEEDKLLLALLRLPGPRAILLELYLDGPVSPRELADAVGIPGSNLSYFLKRLEALRVLVREGEGAERRVRLVAPVRIHEILLRYPPLPETALDRFLRFWSELHP